LKRDKRGQSSTFDETAAQKGSDLKKMKEDEGFNSPFSICQSAIEFEIPTRPGHWHGMQRRAGQGQPGLDNILMKELDYIE